MPTYDIGPCECCGNTGTGSPLCDLCENLRTSLTLTIDAVTGISCPGNISVGTTVTLTKGASGWSGSFQASDGEWVDLLFYCKFDLGAGAYKIYLRTACRGSGGIFDETEVEAGYSCDPEEFVFIGCGLTGVCCGGTSGSIDCTVTI